MTDSAVAAMPLGCMGTEGWFLGDRNKGWVNVKRAEEDPISIQVLELSEQEAESVPGSLVGY